MCAQLYCTVCNCHSRSGGGRRIGLYGHASTSQRLSPHSGARKSPTAVPLTSGSVNLSWLINLDYSMSSGRSSALRPPYERSCSSGTAKASRSTNAGRGLQVGERFNVVQHDLALLVGHLRTVYLRVRGADAGSREIAPGVYCVNTAPVGLGVASAINRRHRNALASSNRWESDPCR